MNTNLLHNVLNIAIVLIGAIGTIDAAGWASMGISATLAASIVTGLGTLKLIINALRDGLSGMTKPQPPVGDP